MNVDKIESLTNSSSLGSCSDYNTKADTRTIRRWHFQLFVMYIL